MSWRSFRRWQGGSVHLTRDPIDVGQLMGAVAGPSRGGTTAFVGSVRRGLDDGPVVAIEYSAYEDMAEPEFERILSEASEQWPDARALVQHRLGRIETGEASIAVVCAAPHSAEAFAVCRYVVEQVKQRVPVWKKEISEDGDERWRANNVAEERG